MTQYRDTIRIFALLAGGGLSLSGCALFSEPADSAPARPVNVAHIPDAVPRAEPRSARGNPPSYEVFGRTYFVMASAEGYNERGVASWYGTKFHGRSTSSGEPYDMYKMTAAHRTLPIPSYVEVTNLQTRRKVIVRVNDRGPFHANRIIDLSYAAATKLGISGNGTGLVEVRSIDPRQWQRPTQLTPVAAPAQTPVNGTPTPRMFVQAGAFTNSGNARQLQQQLHTLLNSHPVSAEFDQNDKLYRVRIGPIGSVEEADRLSELISANGFDEPHIVID